MAKTFAGKSCKIKEKFEGVLRADMGQRSLEFKDVDVGMGVD